MMHIVSGDWSSHAKPFYFVVHSILNSPSSIEPPPLLARTYIIIYTLSSLSSQIAHSWVSYFGHSSSPDGSDVACIRWSFRSMYGSHQGSFSWFILLDCAVIVLLHSSLKGVKGPSFPSELNFFSPHVSILFMGKWVQRSAHLKQLFLGKIWFVFRICSIFATANEKQTASRKKANPSEGGWGKEERR